MMECLKYLSDEVTRLRQIVKGNCESAHSSDLNTQPSTSSTHASNDLKIKRETAKNAVEPGANSPHSHKLREGPTEPAYVHFQNGQRGYNSKVEDQMNAIPNLDAAEKAPQVGNTKKGMHCPPLANLIKTYNSLNDQIITNERALEDSVAYLREVSVLNEARSRELRTQLDELRVYIDVEKGKRDDAVAAIIAKRWHTKQLGFRLLLENMAVKSKADAEKAFHEECAEIAHQLEEKNRVLSKLSGLIGAGRLGAGSPSGGNEIPKYAIVRTAKKFLERHRDDVFMCLLRSSPRIYLLTKEKLVGPISNEK
ncbi:unnamed protein product [Phytophthora lilii]|uniref:Unnamed protein product n=1 Tax=Phytophthora lilii TaxID=2077276 RepID=A0A9W6UEA0_9STRA|nr:unnamed protein product [Phytophthora lilii]